MKLTTEMADAISAFTDEAPHTTELKDGMGRVRLEDVPLAEYLAPILQPRIRYVPQLGWLRFNGKMWKRITNEQVNKHVQRWILTLVQRETLDANIDADRRRRLTSLLTAGRVKAVRSLLQGLLEQSAEEFDAHAYLLNVQNGVVDLRTGELGPHDPDLLFTKIAPVAYRAGAQHPDWDEALQALADEDTRDWVQAKFGQAITGQPPADDVLPILHGDGKNGKSTLLNVQYALGHADHGGYATVVPERLLTARPSDHPTELMTLRGTRFAVLEELPDKAINIARLKNTLGSPRLNARLIGQNNASWDASHTLILSTNYKPRVSESDFGTWRRLALVVFPFRYRREDEALERPNDRRGSDGLRDRLKEGLEQREAMLSWMVEGAKRVYQGGDEQHLPDLPESVKANTMAWRAESDLLLRFADDRLEFDPDGCVLAKDLYAEFERFTEGSGHRKWAENTFAERLTAHDLATQHNLRKERTRSFGAISRPRRGGSRIPQGKASVWFGVTFRDGETA
ncbi:DNA primase family protein [Gordonia aichiensis]